VIGYFLVPLSVCVLIGFQITFFDILFMGALRVELSLVLVIFAGFRLSIPKGALLAFSLGFCLDALVSTIPYFHLTVYMFMFTISKMLSLRMYAEHNIVVMLITALASLCEGFFMVLIFRYFYGSDMGFGIFCSILLQAVILGGVSPALFYIFDKIEVLMSVGESQKA